MSSRQAFIDQAATAAYASLVSCQNDGHAADRMAVLAYQMGEVLWSARNRYIDNYHSQLATLDWEPATDRENTFYLNLGGGFYLDVFQHNDPVEPTVHLKWTARIANDDFITDWGLYDEPEEDGGSLFDDKASAQARGIQFALKKLGAMGPRIEQIRKMSQRGGT